MTTAYSQMNLNDRFVQALLKPHARLTVRADVHWLSLAQAADGWYFGSGATQEEGASSGSRCGRRAATPVSARPWRPPRTTR